jgi:hypothetical protein
VTRRLTTALYQRAWIQKGDETCAGNHEGGSNDSREVPTSFESVQFFRVYRFMETKRKKQRKKVRYICFAAKGLLQTSRSFVCTYTLCILLQRACCK